MTTSATPTDPFLVVRCLEPTGKRGHVCGVKVWQQALRQRRAMLIIHIYRHKRRGADLRLDLRPSRRSLPAALRRTLEDRFQVLELTGWLLPGGLQMISPWGCQWKKVPLVVLDTFVAELTALVASSYWPAPKTESTR
jgi:hypothetical protein